MKPVEYNGQLNRRGVVQGHAERLLERCEDCALCNALFLAVARMSHLLVAHQD